MKIISKFHDYYDHGMGFGHDDHVVYVRQPEELGAFQDKERFDVFDALYRRARPKLTSDELRLKDFSLRIFPSCLFFCGKIYPYIRISRVKEFPSLSYKYPDFKKVYNTLDEEFYYDLDSYVKGLLKYNIKLDDFNNYEKYNRWYNRNESCLSNKYVVQFFLNSGTDQYLQEITDLKIVSAARNHEAYKHDDPKYYVNPMLSEYQFYKMYDPYSAFQEVEMFIGGVLGDPGNPMADIDDKHLAKQKGFDCYSFKTLPTKKGKKSCDK